MDFFKKEGVQERASEIKELFNVSSKKALKMALSEEARRILSELSKAIQEEFGVPTFTGQEGDRYYISF